MTSPKSCPFENLRYADFQRMALDPGLSPNEKIGFPDTYRDGYESAIHADICSKLSNLQRSSALVLDIGPGCARLPRLMMADCEARGQSLVLVDSQEMLSQLPDGSHVTKVAGFYPDCVGSLESWAGRFDVIVCYSVLHYVFVEASLWRFIDASLGMLAPGGQMLIGDVPNVSKRKRFFASSAGVRFHQEFMRTSDVPEVDFTAVETDKIDDAVILGIVMRVRAQGCDAYWLPQAPGLPMANRREDILIRKP
jgi:2-polyprenyl-3-methyl-5-hydroxy-6-metoxy-1,4-benzoquinol methylase